MGQSASVPLRLASFSSRQQRTSAGASTVKPAIPADASLSLATPEEVEPWDHTAGLPDEVLALIFQSLGSGDRKGCSLVCRRWLTVEGQNRHRLSLDARAALLEFAPALFARFDAISKLALKCDRRADSIGDGSLELIGRSCPNLTRLKLRACRELTETGMAALAKHCSNLRKLSCGSCTFGARGIEAVLRGCPLLEELSIKRLRGLTDAASEIDGVAPYVAASSLRSICLKELYNGQCFSPIIAGSPNLRTLKLFRCAGDWDRLLEEVSERVLGLVEIHLEKLQVSDRGLFALSFCSELEILHLVKTPECTDAGLISVAEKCRLLRKLHIDGWKTNRIGDWGLMAVARRCPNLQELVLIGVNPTPVSLDVIASSCRNLERLALCGSDTFGDKEISCIAAKCVALKKLCIKGCPVTDHGMESLAEGCPNLVKVKVRKCKSVTPQCADWLRATRGSLAVNLDNIYQTEPQDGSMSESGMMDNGVEELQVLDDPVANIGVPSSNRIRHWKRIGFIWVRSFFSSTFRRRSHGTSNFPSS
ncbi:F-box protein [Apostasia shenzhenica]|uniref:F-box protein n=1 Tax=Apostasia shenzhenica TaxID=1088818 RepID=A0A2I0B6Z4_9ASPA|nr:F-box protein [Apostasia shenzhenica]